MHLVRVLLVLVLVLATAVRAMADTVAMDFCVWYNIAYTDAAMGDLMTGSTAKGRGILLRFVKPDSTYFGHYMEWNGTNAGCRTILLDDTIDYDVKVVYQAENNGNMLYVLDDQGAVFETTVETDLQPVSAGYRNYYVGTNARTHVMAAAGWAMASHNYGVTGAAFRFVLDPCPQGGTSCDRWTWNGIIYIDNTSDHHLYKQIVVHELGHAMADAANGGNEDVNDDSAVLNQCDGNGYDRYTHQLNSKEYQSNAAVEGIANFYAAITFNSNTGSNAACEYYTHARVDWNHDDDTDLNDPLIFSCEGGIDMPSNDGPDIDNFDFMGDFCDDTGEYINRGTEYDWLRHFWDLYTDYGYSAGTILDIWAAASPDTWNTTGEGAGPGYPAYEMWAAAYDVGGQNMQDDYEACADDNGVWR